MRDVLIVDDTSTVRQEVAEYLGKHNIESDQASDGLEAYDLIKQNSYKLVLLDINMPNLDGLGLVEKLKSELPEKKPKIVMLTTEFDQELKERGKKGGINGWIIKPFNGDKAINAIIKMIN